MKLLIHSQTSTVQTLKFGNGLLISCHTLLDMRLPIQLCPWHLYKLIRVCHFSEACNRISRKNHITALLDFSWGEIQWWLVDLPHKKANYGPSVSISWYHHIDIGTNTLRNALMFQTTLTYIWAHLHQRCFTTAIVWSWIKVISSHIGGCVFHNS